MWNYRHGNPGEKSLRRVADGETVLVSTGANDWLNSSGALEPCEGGFRYSGSKAFSSRCPAGDVLITSGRYNDPSQGWQVLHFPISLRAEGVRIGEDWKAMGMRGTGSHTRRRDDLTATLLGEMENELTTAVLAFESMVGIANDLDFEPSAGKTSEILIRKTIATQAVIRTASKALEVVGGTGYFRPFGLERLIRDAYAGQFHPLTPKKQHLFTGRICMGLDADDGAAAAVDTR